MANPDPAGRECALSELPRGVPATIVNLPADASRLLWHGVRVGATVVVEADAPLGGPRIICLGSSRLALAREVTRDVVVRPNETAAVPR